MLRRLAVFAGMLLFAGVSLNAQSERGSIRGTVQDSSGAMVPGAKVTAISVGTNVETSTVSTEAGNYNIPQLPPGAYKVQAQGTGFRTLIRENVIVQVSGVTPLDLILEVGQITESVTVAAAAPLLK